MEDFIAKRNGQLSDKKNGIKNDLEKMNKKLSILQKSCKNEQLSKIKEEWLEDVNKSIEEKAAELECPVCLETCTPPIHMCSNGHLICNVCSPSCKNCPKCRVDFNKPILRNRMAEQMLFAEVQKLTQKRENIFLKE